MQMVMTVGDTMKIEKQLVIPHSLVALLVQVLCAGAENLLFNYSKLYIPVRYEFLYSTTLLQILYKYCITKVLQDSRNYQES